MEKTNDRTLAYLMAKSIEYSDLETISGGANQVLTTKPSVHLDGDSARGPRIDFDISCDA